MKPKPGIVAILTVMLAGCGMIPDDSDQVRQDLVLLPEGSPSATVIHNNTTDFEVTVVYFQECETKSTARPDPQVIPPGGSASYQVAPGCYETWSGSSTKFATRKAISPQAGETIVLP